MGRLLKIALLDDRLYIILLRLFRFGIIKTHSKNLNGISIVLGFWKIEFQTNLSLVNKTKINLRDYGRA
jgi:hypothetical protein|tara:strand:+ start:5004 stop:5210 length:207 start_codon:yes stop_codon:yes gene_type:complete